MDHDHELLYDQAVGRSTVRESGPIADFLAKKNAEQEPKTYVGYRGSLLRLQQFLGDDATVGDLNQRAGRDFLADLRGKGLSKNTVATYFRDLKAFTRWLHQTGWTERDRFADLKRPEFVRPKFDTLTAEQKQAILVSFNPGTFLGARNLAVLCLFMDTGMRRQELAEVKEKRVHLAEGYVEVYGDKTDEWRIIPLSQEVVRVIQNYLRVRDRYFEKPCRHRARPDDVNHRRKSVRELHTDTLFCSWSGDGLTGNAVRLMIDRVREQLKRNGLPLRLHAHLFRHNFLTEKALDGENPSLVKRWAGHKKYEMTDYYFGIAEDKLAAIQPRQSTLAGAAPARTATHRRQADASERCRISGCSRDDRATSPPSPAVRPMIHVSRYDLTGIGQQGRHALLHGMQTVAETALIAAADALQGRLPDHASAIWDWLPPEFSNRYTANFFVAFAASALVVGWKLTDPDTIYPLASVVEELALHAIFGAAEQELPSSAGRSARSLADLFTALIEDEDFLLLFNSTLLDIQDQPAIQEQVPTANLRFVDWCKPFNDVRHVAALVFRDEKRWAACWTGRQDWWESGEGNDEPGDDSVRPALVKPPLYRKCADCALFVVPDAGKAEPSGFVHLTTGQTDHLAWPSTEGPCPLSAWPDAGPPRADREGRGRRTRRARLT
jgi:site-specific recombinase XerD